MAVAPNITYTITYRDNPVELGSTIRGSFAEGWNTINVTYRSNISLSRYEARVTKEGEEYDLGIGSLVYYSYGSISANEDHKYLIIITDTDFDRGKNTYRISLYALNAIDKTWDVTYLLLTSDLKEVVDNSGTNLEVYAQGDNYSISRRTDDDSVTIINLNGSAQNGNTVEVK